uniref:SEA domain-containing protein n=1 Tax=Panagrellus redivivus TaxID=6233 RepID=A0A7E4VY10_PANRE
MAISAATAVALVALVYRVTLNLPDMPYSNDLRNKSSPTFAEYSQQVIDGVDFLLKPLPGFHSVSVREFRYQAVVGTMTILDVISMNTKGAEQAKKLFKDAIEAGHIGWLDVAPEGFEFHVIPVNSTSDGKYDFSFARPTVTCPDGSIPEYSLYVNFEKFRDGKTDFDDLGTVQPIAGAIQCVQPAQLASKPNVVKRQHLTLIHVSARTPSGSAVMALAFRQVSVVMDFWIVMIAAMS